MDNNIEIPNSLRLLCKLMSLLTKNCSNTDQLYESLILEQMPKMGVEIPSNIGLETIKKWMQSQTYESNNSITILCGEIINEFDETKYQLIVSFCLKVLQHNDIVNMESLIMIEQLIYNLKIEERWYRDELHKTISVDFLDKNEDIYPIYLGIEKFNNDEDKKDYLTQMYMKWNPVSTNSDSIKSNRAKKILDLIKKCRANI